MALSRKDSVRPKLTAQHTDIGRHIDWRVRYLRAAGVDRATVRSVAYDMAFDLSTLVDIVDLIDRGCPPELAVRIVAPLDRSA